MSYVIAFSVDGGAIDVSRAYIPTKAWEGEDSGKEIREMRGRAGREEEGSLVSAFGVLFRVLLEEEDCII